VVNTWQIRDFDNTTAKLTITDKISESVITEFAKKQPEVGRRFQVRRIPLLASHCTEKNNLATN
jgi:hypothetical protein